MPSIPYNDDVDMSIEGDNNDRISDIDIDDDSSHNPSPSIDPIPVEDTTERPIDQWVKDTTDTGGDPGTEYNDTPPIEKDPLSPPVYKTVIRKTREIIHDYSQSYLRQLYDGGAKFYVVYKDGTENEVEYTEIYDPHQIHTSTYVNEAQAIAEATEQHFWHDDNGAHVTDVEQDDWKTAANANFNDLSDSKPYHNILMNSLGILLRRALYSLVSISKSAITFYDGFGNNLENIRASFGSTGATFRENGKTKATITPQGFSVYDNDGSVSGNNETLGSRLAFIGVDDSGNPYTRIGKSAKGYIDIGVNNDDNGYIDFYNNSILLAHIGYDSGTNASGGTSLAPYYNFGSRKANTTIGNYSLSEGVETEASGYAAHAEGNSTIASGAQSHAEGHSTTASNYYSHAEGVETEASSDAAHAEGRSTTASGHYSHAEGGYTTASNYYSHAEGYDTKASGEDSHAEGRSTKASKYCSHAEGVETEASSDAAHAEGRSTTASGHYSHAEGGYTTASNYYSHAEGYDTKASGEDSHAEGIETEASGYAAHAEGRSTTASGQYTHASGYYTTAGYSYQFVFGKYNSNSSSDLFEIGNGSSDTARSNAFRVTTSNTAYMGSTSVTSDKRIKTDLGELNSNQAIDFIKELIPHKYEKFGRKELGFFAQDVEKDPNYGDILVEQYEGHGYTDFRSLSYDGLIAPIVSVEQNLISRIEELERQCEILENQNTELLRRLDAIESKLN